jgi:hypothetical protein
MRRPRGGGPGNDRTTIFCTPAYTRPNSQVIGKSLTDITNDVGTLQYNRIRS